MKYVTAGFLLVGVALFGSILYHTGLLAVWLHLREIGWWGIVVILLVNVLTTLVDVTSWQLTLPSTRPAKSWLYRLWKVFMAGESISNTTPLASLGGEPMKVMLLNEQYGISYREGTVSLFLHQTVVNIGLVLFLLSSLPLIFQVQFLSSVYKQWISVALLTFSGCIWLFFALQRYRVVSWINTWIGWQRSRRRLLSFIDAILDIENQLVTFYTKHYGRFMLTVALASMRWILGVVETY